jgi:hypothetical protein
MAKRSIFVIIPDDHNVHKPHHCGRGLLTSIIGIRICLLKIIYLMCCQGSALMEGIDGPLDHLWRIGMSSQLSLPLRGRAYQAN